MERSYQSPNPRSLRVFTGTQVGAAQTEYPGGPESKRKKGRIRGGEREDALRGSVVEWGSRRGRTTLTETEGCIPRWFQHPRDYGVGGMR